MTRQEWFALPDAEKASLARRHTLMARFMTNVELSEREISIIDYTADNVTSEELRSLLARLKRSRYPYELIGELRIYYDDLVNDAEKVVRQHLGLETDYSHTVENSIIHPNSVFKKRGSIFFLKFLLFNCTENSSPRTRVTVRVSCSSSYVR